MLATCIVAGVVASDATQHHQGGGYLCFMFVIVVIVVVLLFYCVAALLRCYIVALFVIGVPLNLKSRLVSLGRVPLGFDCTKHHPSSCSYRQFASRDCLDIFSGVYV
jgi:hypothetical protein